MLTMSTLVTYPDFATIRRLKNRVRGKGCEMRRRWKRRGLGLLWGFHVPTGHVASVSHTVQNTVHQVGVRMQVPRFVADWAGRKVRKEKYVRDLRTVRQTFQCCPHDGSGKNRDPCRFCVHVSYDEKKIRRELLHPPDEPWLSQQQRDSRSLFSRKKLDVLARATKVGVTPCTILSIDKQCQFFKKPFVGSLSDAVLMARVAFGYEQKEKKRKREEEERRRRAALGCRGMSIKAFRRKHFLLNKDFDLLIEQDGPEVIYEFCSCKDVESDDDRYSDGRDGYWDRAEIDEMNRIRRRMEREWGDEF